MKIQQILERAERLCIERGTRLTSKRKRVLECLLRHKNALSAYNIADAFKQEAEGNMPPMSVYRILEFLEDNLLVHKLHTANKYVACSHISCDHRHYKTSQFLICLKCSKVEEVSINNLVIGELHKSIERTEFRMISPQFEINCICNTCDQDKKYSSNTQLI